jgi:hypothetical protein
VPTNVPVTNPGLVQIKEVIIKNDKMTGRKFADWHNSQNTAQF